MFKNGQTTIKDVMVSGHNSLDIFTKLEFVKDLIRNKAGNLTDHEMQISISHCWYHKFGRYKKELTKQEHEILDLLLKEGLSPKRVYNWFLLNDAPEHIKIKVKERKLGLDNAISENAKWKKMTSREGSQQLMDDIREVIRSLRWKSQED